MAFSSINDIGRDILDRFPGNATRRTLSYDRGVAGQKVVGGFKAVVDTIKSSGNARDGKAG